jgi:hypothetical protein
VWALHDAMPDRPTLVTLGARPSHPAGGKASRRPTAERPPQGCHGCLIGGLPKGFRFHDLKHYFASLLITSGADVKVVQRRLWHASAMTTLNTYGRMCPDAGESARAAVGAVMAARADSLSKIRATAD